MTKVSKSILLVASVVCLLVAGVLAGCAGNSSNAETSTSESSSAAEVTAEGVEIATPTMCYLYFKDGTDPEFALKVAEEISTLEGVATVGYVDEETAKDIVKNASEDVKSELIPHAYIEYSVAEGVDVDALNKVILKIDGVAETRLANPEVKTETVDSQSSESSASSSSESATVVIEDGASDAASSASSAAAGK